MPSPFNSDTYPAPGDFGNDVWDFVQHPAFRPNAMMYPEQKLKRKLIVTKCGVPESFPGVQEVVVHPMQTGGEFTRMPLVVKQVETSVGKEWQVAYHGTTFDSVKDILVNGYDDRDDANPNQ